MMDDIRWRLKEDMKGMESVWRWRSKGAVLKSLNTNDWAWEEGMLLDLKADWLYDFDIKWNTSLITCI